MKTEIAERREAYLEFRRMFDERKRQAEAEIYDCIKKWIDILEEEYGASYGASYAGISVGDNIKMHFCGKEDTKIILGSVSLNMRLE